MNKLKKLSQRWAPCITWVALADAWYTLKWSTKLAWDRRVLRYRRWAAASKLDFQLPRVEHDFPIPAGENPFFHDSFNMGTPLVRGWLVMHEGYDRKEDPQPLHYLILVNTRTGQRIRITSLENCS